MASHPQQCRSLSAFGQKRSFDAGLRTLNDGATQYRGDVADTTKSASLQKRPDCWSRQPTTISLNDLQPHLCKMAGHRRVDSPLLSCKSAESKDALERLLDQGLHPSGNPADVLQPDPRFLRAKAYGEAPVAQKAEVR